MSVDKQTPTMIAPTGLTAQDGTRLQPGTLVIEDGYDEPLRVADQPPATPGMVMVVRHRTNDET